MKIEMMKIKVSEATPIQLDWMVAKCEGMLSEPWLWGDTQEVMYRYKFSTDWAQGGPIIEREGIELQFDLYRWNAALGVMRFYIGGPTPLIAAMRCYVASKLGNTIEIPEEIV